MASPNDRNTGVVVFRTVASPLSSDAQKYIGANVHFQESDVCASAGAGRRTARAAEIVNSLARMTRPFPRNGSPGATSTLPR